jgi:hypothetical protein
MQGNAHAGKGCSDTRENEINQSLLEDIMIFILQTPVCTKPTYGLVFTSVPGIGLRKIAVRNSIVAIFRALRSI